MKLLCYDPDSQWAFVEWGGQTVLSRPPYERGTQVTPVQPVPRLLADLSLNHGFLACGEEFEKWPEIHTFLSERIKTHLPVTKLSLYESMSNADVRLLISTIKEDWLSGGSFRVAAELLFDILEVRTHFPD